MDKIIPLEVLDVMDMLISGKDKMAKEMVSELVRTYSPNELIINFSSDNTCNQKKKTI